MELTLAIITGCFAAWITGVTLFAINSTKPVVVKHPAVEEENDLFMDCD